jgi:hypothetical protein
MQLAITGIKQVNLPPDAQGNVQVYVAFSIAGILPEHVQIYAENAAGTPPANLVDTVDIQGPDGPFEDTVKLKGGAYYTVYACPRNDPENPDEQIDGEYWESYCASAVVITQVAAAPAAPLTPPVITSLDPEGATIQYGNRINMTFSGPTPYDKFLISWSGLQGEVDPDNPSTAGAWVAFTTPGSRYTFQVKGGQSGGIFGNYHYSDWGPSVSVVASPNLTSLRQFLIRSGVNPAGAKLSVLLPAGKTLRQFMQV